MQQEAVHTECEGEFTYAGIVWNNYTTPSVIKRCEQFSFRPTDICVCTFPRSGTTLTQEIVWQLLHRTEIRRGEKYEDIDVRFPFLEFNSKYYDSDPYPIDKLEAASTDGVRLIKTHCPLSFIGPQLREACPKIIVVARNPKDCCTSLFHFYKGLDMLGPWSGNWHEFFQIFMQGLTKCGDYFKVVGDWWQARDQQNLLFLKYEDIVRQPAASVNRVAEFLDCELTPEQLDCIVNNSQFPTMAANENVNVKFSTGFQFLRKGVIGDWKSLFTVQQSELMDEAIRAKLHPIGLKFEFE